MFRVRVQSANIMINDQLSCSALPNFSSKDSSVWENLNLITSQSKLKGALRGYKIPHWLICCILASSLVAFPTFSPKDTASSTT